jgi:hypothetical protein
VIPSRKIVVALLLLTFSLPAGRAAEPEQQADWHRAVLREIKHDVSLPLWAIPESAKVPEDGGPASVVEQRASGLPWSESNSQGLSTPLVSTTNLLNFDGLGANNGAIPPDTNGAVGGNQFVQWVNVEYAVYDKTTGQRILGPSNGNTIWSGFGGPCEANNSGEPVVEFDKLAQRWVLAQPVLMSPYYYCVAVSTSSDATATYNRYAFALQLPAGQVPDYPKLAVWPDAYYASFNIYQGSAGGTFLYPLAVAYDRTNMLAGSAARNPIAFTGTASDFNPLPSDVDGTVAPASGEPNFYWELGADSTSVNEYQFHVDFVNPQNSTFLFFRRLKTSRFIACTGNPPKWRGIAERGTTTKLNALDDRLMPRAAWHNVNGLEYSVLNHTVVLSQVPSGSITGIAWYQIQSPATNPQLIDQGVVPGPAMTSYWMGSIAMDKAGDIALGFSNSGPTIFPGIEYTGRVPTDPPGTMETPSVIVNGGGSQLNSSLWGAYSSMSIDPSDDCTFWYTTEYEKTNGTGNWSTRIASFKFSSCM